MFGHPRSRAGWLGVVACVLFCFFFNDTATTEIYTLSLHDALPISQVPIDHGPHDRRGGDGGDAQDRKSTRLNSSHGSISYAVFCLTKKKNITTSPDNSSSIIFGLASNTSNMT